MRSRNTRFVCLAILTSLLGCGGGGSSAPKIQTVYNPLTVVLAPDDSRQITAATDDTVTISGDTSAIHVGSIIASGQGEGLLRKVSGVVSTGASTTYSTGPANLEDAIQAADLQDKRTLGAADIAKFVPSLPGVTMEGRARDGGGAAITLTLASVEPSPGVKFSGKLKLGVEVETAARLAFSKIERFTCDTAIIASATVKLTSEVSKKVSVDVLLGKLVGVPFLFAPGIVVTPEINVYLAADGTAKLGFDLTNEASVTAKAGIQYQGNQWTTSHSVSHKVSFVPDLDLAATLELSLTPVRPQLLMRIDGIIGPYVSANAPTYKNTLAAKSSPAGLDLSIKSVYNAEIGVNAAVLGYEIFDQKFDLPLEGEVTAYHKFFPLDGSGGVGVK